MVRQLFGSLASRSLEKQKLSDSMLWNCDKGCLIYIVLSREKCAKSLVHRVKSRILTAPESRGQLADFQGGPRPTGGNDDDPEPVLHSY